MNIEKLFERVDCFKNIKMDVILFESTYPIMFTCRDEDDIYLFICCIMNSKSVKWIGTTTSYEILISLLKDKITIQEAFLADDVRKIIIEYYGGEDSIHYSRVDCSEIPKEWLPTAGEYMDVEENEFQEEIKLFQI